MKRHRKLNYGKCIFLLNVFFGFAFLISNVIIKIHILG